MSGPAQRRDDLVEIYRTASRCTLCPLAAGRTQVVFGKEKRMGQTMGRRPNWKKAIVKLKEGDSIEIFEG